MSQKNDISQEKIDNGASDNEKTSKLVVKKKRIKKPDILVFCVCLVVSVVVWMYASNLQKTAQEKELDKDAVADAVVDKIEEKESNKESNRESLLETTAATEQNSSDCTEINT